MMKGAVLGLFLFGLFAFLMHGLQTTSASNGGFLTSTTVVLVPLFHAVIKKKMPDHQNVLSILLTMTGICLLTLQQSLVFHSGDILCLAGAAVYAVQILLTDKFAQEEDGMLLGIWQLGFAALYGVICTFMFETPTLPSSGFQWIAILGLAFVCSAFGFVMQPMAQKYTTPEHTGLLFALEPVFSAVFSYIFLHETFVREGLYGRNAGNGRRGCSFCCQEKETAGTHCGNISPKSKCNCSEPSKNFEKNRYKNASILEVGSEQLQVNIVLKR